MQILAAKEGPSRRFNQTIFPDLRRSFSVEYFPQAARLLISPRIAVKWAFLAQQHDGIVLIASPSLAQDRDSASELFGFLCVCLLLGFFAFSLLFFFCCFLFVVVFVLC